MPSQSFELFTNDTMGQICVERKAMADAMRLQNAVVEVIIMQWCKTTAVQQSYFTLYKF